MISQYTFTGNLGTDSQLGLAGQSSILKFRVAVKTGWGERENTHWVGCQIWGKRATEKVASLLVKGARVTVTGNFAVREYTRKSDGATVSDLSVDVSEMDIHPRVNATAPPIAPAAPTPVSSSTPPPDDDFDLDDVPF